MSDVAQAELAASRRPQKSEAAFRTISEVSEDLDVPQHVLRFWESRFPVIKPLKRGGGRRYYRPEDIQLLRRIRDLLYRDGYTIRGVQKLLREQSRGAAAGEALEAPAPAGPLFAPPVPAPAASPPPAPPVQVAPPPPPSAPAPAAAPERAPAPPTTVLSGARRALLQSLIGEIDALRAELAQALKPPGK